MVGGVVLKDVMLCFVFLSYPISHTINVSTAPRSSAFIFIVSLITNTEAIFASVLGNFIEVFANQIFLLDEFHVAKCLRRELNGLVESILATIRHVHNFQDDLQQPVVKQVTLSEFRLEISGA